jgi:molybdate transport system regulatory protein
MLSAGNQFEGTVKEINAGHVMAEVVVSVGDIEVSSIITRPALDRLNIKSGDTVRAVIKSTDVMIDK